MNSTAIGVAAGLLLAGGALYGGYALITAAPDDRPAAADAGGPEAAESGAGVPGGTRALDFADGADGADRTAAERLRAEEAAREAERLAALGRGDVELQRAPGERRRRGLRDSADDIEDVSGSTDADVERMLADIAAASGGETANAKLVDKPDSGGFTANKRLTDKPDTGGFAANTRLTDKPDPGGFVANADTRALGPCVKADGTRYVGPGTAVNPFAEGDPCLPQATTTSVEVAVADPATPLTPVDPDPPITIVDVTVPRIPPPTTTTGSDYRG